MENKSTCEYCNGNGLITVFHRDYRGDPTVWVDRVDARGECIKLRLPGSIAAHCTCSKGRWMRSRIDEEIRKRIPDLQTVLDGRTDYQLLDPTELEVQEMTPEAEAFIRQWRNNFGGRLLKEAPQPPPKRNPDDVANEIRQQIEERKRQTQRIEEPAF